MLAGKLAALSALEGLGQRVEGERRGVWQALARLRAGPFGRRPRLGKEKLFSLMKEMAYG
jgi:hypothetical protein